MYLRTLPGALSTGALLLHTVWGLRAVGAPSVLSPDGSVPTAQPGLLGLCFIQGRRADWSHPGGNALQYLAFGAFLTGAGLSSKFQKEPSLPVTTGNTG